MEQGLGYLLLLLPQVVLISSITDLEQFLFKAAFTLMTFSCENRHFAFFLPQIAHVTYTTQDSREILSARYCQTRPPKSQIAAGTHTGEILTRCSHTIATRRNPSLPQPISDCVSRLVIQNIW